ncbi:hypothetical protein H2198_003342 [Neophaeococcomyces mojaviensis]|uniref:Uncharacterized protein n=1 Tax=Neophaeococcomyces mojaviensis TaxID=3383035 RepID=A0ACC3AC16_9EURO|nr:hypothetical protein H2198_003342 [Knufia sp. JES_112]
MARPISKDVGMEILTGDVTIMENRVKATITAPLAQNQLDAIISYIFNVGPGRITPLATAINAGNYAGAENAIRSGVGDKKRRAVEANVFISF